MVDEKFQKKLADVRSHIHSKGMVTHELSAKLLRTIGARLDVKRLEKVKDVEKKKEEILAKIIEHDLSTVITDAGEIDILMLEEMLEYYLSMFDLHLFLKAEVKTISDNHDKMPPEMIKITTKFLKDLESAMEKERSLINSLNAKLQGKNAGDLSIALQEISGHKAGFWDYRNLRKDFKEVYHAEAELLDTVKAAAKGKLTDSDLEKLKTALETESKDILDILRRETYVALEVLEARAALMVEYAKAATEHEVPNAFAEAQLEKANLFKAVMEEMLMSMQRMVQQEYHAAKAAEEAE